MEELKRLDSGDFLRSRSAIAAGGTTLIFIAAVMIPLPRAPAPAFTAAGPAGQPTRWLALQIRQRPRLVSLGGPSEASQANRKQHRCWTI